MQKSQFRITRNVAERKLDAIQFGGAPVSMKLNGVPVTVEPEPGNMFRIRIDASAPNASAAAGFLNDIGADIRPWPCPEDGVIQSELTWDSTLHYLIMPGNLKYT